MKFFSKLDMIDDQTIQTNVSWIFLALCNNGITGKQMLENGITRDMFLVSCNPQFSQLRHLVIAGFAELGRKDTLEMASVVNELDPTLLKIKQKAIVGFNKVIQSQQYEKTCKLLLNFCLSKKIKYSTAAYDAIKDLILLTSDKAEELDQHQRKLIRALIIGCASKVEQIQSVSSLAISYLITTYLVFTKREEQEIRQMEEIEGHLAYEFDERRDYILDALLHLTGSEFKASRVRAFSTLSCLSTNASNNSHVKYQIERDL